jgi:hypothetical protein
MRRAAVSNSKKKELEDHWKVRITGEGWIIHTASFDEPVLEQAGNGEVLSVTADWCQDSDYGDVLVKMDWRMVIGVTARKVKG